MAVAIVPGLGYHGVQTRVGLLREPARFAPVVAAARVDAIGQDEQRLAGVSSLLDFVQSKHKCVHERRSAVWNDRCGLRVRPRRCLP